MIRRKRRPGPARSSGDSNRYSRFVDLMRLVLPATALLLTGLILAWPAVMGGYGGLIVPLLASGQTLGIDDLGMAKPRYVGRTSSNADYELTAERAEIDPVQPDLIGLETLHADIQSQTGRDIDLTAVTGLYRRQQQRLDLSGGIEVTTSDGYRFETPSALVWIEDGLVRGQDEIAGAGPAGTLRADRFEISQGGDVLYFEGRVRVTVPTGPAGDVSTVDGSGPAAPGVVPPTSDDGLPS